MKFVDRLKGKVSETKEKVAVARDKKQVKEMVSRLRAYPLCSETDAYWIVEGEMTRYFGRHDCFSIDMDTASEAEIDAEMDNLAALADQMRVFLGFLFDPDFEYSPSLLKGSINVVFHRKILEYLDETEFEISQEKFISILESMVNEASGEDIQDAFTNNLVDKNKLDMFSWFQDYKEKFFPDLALIKLGNLANEKLQQYLELREITDPIESFGDDIHERRAKFGNLPVAVALASDTIGGGEPIRVLPMRQQEFVEMYVGQASVLRMIKYHAPSLLTQRHVLSLRDFSVDIKAESNIHWHFCEEGIIETTLSANSIPKWLPSNKIKELVFGEAYDGLSQDGVTEFERYYLYMIVRTSLGPTFTLFKFLGKNSQKALEAWTDLGEEALPTLAGYYNVKISDQVHDVSKHYKTTYTTYTTTWSW